MRAHLNEAQFVSKATLGSPPFTFSKSLGRPARELNPGCHGDNVKFYHYTSGPITV